MYQPQTGTGLVVSLPGETVRAEVVRVADRDTVVVELLAPLLNPSRLHQYRVGDVVCCKRAWHELGESWEAVDERRLPSVPVESKRKAPAKRKAKKKTSAARRRK